MKDLIEQLKERSEDRATHDERLIGEAADLLERVYSQPVELPEGVAWRTFDGEGGYDYRAYDDNENYAAEWARRNPNHSGWVDQLYTSDQLTKAVQEATARALEAAARECDARYMGDNNREDMEAKRCADAIRNLIGNVPLRGVK